MAFVLDQIKAIDAHLERLEVADLEQWSDADSVEQVELRDTALSLRANHLRALIKSLSTSPKAKKVSTASLLAALQEAELDATRENSIERALEWLLVSRVTIHTHGQALDTFLQNTYPINDELSYWEDVIDSRFQTGLAVIQTFPSRLARWTKTRLDEAQAEIQPRDDRWAHYYDVVHRSLQKISVASLQKRMASPFTIVRSEIWRKQASLNHAKLLNASAVGHVISESFSPESLRDNFVNRSEHAIETRRKKWRTSVIKSITVITDVLKASISAMNSTENYEDGTTDPSSDDPLTDLQQTPGDANVNLSSSAVAKQLREILEIHLPSFGQKSNLLLAKNSRPSRLTRYWPAAAGLLFFSTTMLRYCLNRKSLIEQWASDTADTVVGFWSNWVVQPTRNLIGIIRHDADSEISVSNKKSLEADRASLDRMVIDFVAANSSSPLGEAEVAGLKAKLAEGDITAVLEVYEKELARPLLGSLKGSLIRALLIQVQKVKVDVDIAMRGIDTLLKSQELTFGFVGLTPGVLVCLATVRYLSSVSDRRRGVGRAATLQQAKAILRNIDRILTGSPQQDSQLSFQDHGLLVCEAVRLQSLAYKTLLNHQYREFMTDFLSLIDVQSGVRRQLAIVDRIVKSHTSWA